jgi:hypothetical protein
MRAADPSATAHAVFSVPARRPRFCPPPRRTLLDAQHRAPSGLPLPAALAAYWLTAVWDQTPPFAMIAPAEVVAEAVAARWLLDMFGLRETPRSDL